jgi:hypothetical protein
MAPLSGTLGPKLIGAANGLVDWVVSLVVTAVEDDTVAVVDRGSIGVARKGEGVLRPFYLLLLVPLSRSGGLRDSSGFFFSFAAGRVFWENFATVSGLLID